LTNGRSVFVVRLVEPGHLLGIILTIGEILEQFVYAGKSGEFVIKAPQVGLEPTTLRLTEGFHVVCRELRIVADSLIVLLLPILGCCWFQ